MLDSINIGTTGLTGFSKELQTISNNVANLNTNGFKGSTTEFAAVFSAEGDSGTPGHGSGQSGGGLTTLASVVNFSQGQINQTTNDLDTAIDGSGFFVLRDTSGKTFYTRAGAFKFNDDGVLVNSAGQHVQGLSTQGALQDITLSGLKTNAAKASTTVTMSGSLSTADTDKSVNATVTDAAGGTHTLAVNFHNNTAATAGSWLVTVMDGTTTVASGEVRFLNGLIDAGFSSVSFTYSPNGVAAMPLVLKMDPSTNSAAVGASTLDVSSVDGYGKGDMTKSTFDSTGKLVITYSNGQTSNTQQLAIATFDSTAALREVDGNNFVADNPKSVHLGVATAGATTIDPSSLEGSNVDLSKEFSDIIITQRGYQASSELVSTANQMLDTLMHMKS